MPRVSIDPALRSKTHTFSCYPEEWAAIEQLTVELKLHTPFDVVRKLVARSKDKKVAAQVRLKVFREPRAASDRTLTTRAVRSARGAVVSA